MSHFYPKKFKNLARITCRAQTHQKSYFASLTLAFKSLLYKNDGQVAALFAMVIFFGMLFTGLSIQYSTYVQAAGEIKSLADKAALAGGIKCRESFLARQKANPNNYDANAAQAITDGQTFGRTEFQKVLDHASSSIAKATFTLTGARLNKPNGPNPNVNYCTMTLNYASNVHSMIKGVDFPLVGKTVSIAFLDEDTPTVTEVDFVADISGSMSTISDPSMRDKAMYVLNLDNPPPGGQSGGCIFFCHARSALLPTPTSDRIKALPTTGPGTQVTVNYNAQYDGGSSTFRLTRDYYIELTINKEATSGDTKLNDQLVPLNTALSSVGIGTKSYALFAGLNQFVAALKASPRKNDTYAAFHRFSAPYSTRPGDPVTTLKEYLPMQLIANVRLDSWQFDFSVPDVRNSTTDVPYFTPPTLVNTSDLTPLSFSGTDALVGRNSINFRTARTKGFPTYNATPVRPMTDIENALKEMLEVIKARPPLPPGSIRIVVLLTDGVDAPRPFPFTPFAMGAQFCKPLKDEGVIVMTMHSYYRLQPGNDQSQALAQRLRGDMTPLTRANVDEYERIINEGALKKGLSDCASPNFYPTAANPTYYFSYLGGADMAAAFTALTNAVTSITKPPLKPVFILE